MPIPVNSSNYRLFDELLLNQERKLYSSIELLNWDEDVLKEVQGVVTDGAVSIDGNSPIRRTLSLSFVVQENNQSILTLSNDISINKKIRVFIGLENTTSFKSYGDVIWFQLGVFVLTDVQISHTIDTNSISITAMDKMALLTGDIAGQSEFPMDYGGYTDTAGGQKVYKSLSFFDIIRNVVAQFGGENPGRILINDVPLYGKQVHQVTGTANITGKLNNTSQIVTLTPNQYVYKYFTLGPTSEEELTKDSGTPLQEVLEDIKNRLGNYEYYYDVYGNFIFQEKKNFINQSFTPIFNLTAEDYLPNFNNTPYIYNFIDKHIVQDYNNVPNIKGIKNNFYVYGANGICYHVAIDKKPRLYNSVHPWQYEIVRIGDEIKKQAAATGSLYVLPRWYEELKTYFVYDDTTKRGIYKVDDPAKAGLWRDKNGSFTALGNPVYWDYYFDIIDEGSILGQFSIDNIGKRTQSETDEEILNLYHPPTTNYVIISQTEVNSNAEVYKYVIQSQQPYLVVSDADAAKITVVSRGAKTAWDRVRELMYIHTSYNEVVSINALPLYFLEANNKVLMQDDKTSVAGDYFINSINIPLGIEGLMSLSAIKVFTRL